MSDNITNNGEPLKKKRGRKKKSEIISNQLSQNTRIVEPSINIIMSIEENDNSNFQNDNLLDSIAREETIINTEPVLKKRGRKPKGGKLILKPNEKIDSAKTVANVILHLKCSMQELNEHNNKLNQIFTDPLSYNPSIPPNILSFNINESKPFSKYETDEISNNENILENQVNNNDYAYKEFEIKQPILSNGSTICNCCTDCPNSNINNNVKELINTDDSEINLKDVNMKLKKLKLQLYKTSNPDKKSACFWCTYDYDNQTCYIPKYEMDGQLYGYGSFCRPECAVAYLMEEKLDDSTKFERYHLLNQIYSKIYDYKKNIKPAPNPYFLLDKFYGNLSIQEYRKLLKTEHMLLVIDKPMTRILPELHEDNEDFITNIYGGKQTQTSSNTGVYKVKRQSEKQKGPSKTSIMKENFGF